MDRNAQLCITFLRGELVLLRGISEGHDIAGSLTSSSPSWDWGECLAIPQVVTYFPGTALEHVALLETF